MKSKVFDRFPFPDPPDALKAKLRAAGEDLDAHRKRVLAEHPDLTLTGLYNVLEKIREPSLRAERSNPGATASSTGNRSSDSWVASPAARNDGTRNNGGTTDAKTIQLTAKEEDIKNRGLVLILKELHEEIDRLTADAYGWPHDLSDEDILGRLVALNAERAKEEAAGHVRWLRPDYQIPRFGKKVATKTAELDLAETVVAIDAGLPAFPSDAGEATLAIEAILAASGKPATAAEIARGFKRGGKRIEQKVLKALGTLNLYGRVVSEGDAFVVRRAA